MDKNLIIDPFNENRLNSNSYNLLLHNELLVYEDALLDMKKKHKMKKIRIPDEGYILEPGKLYLGRTFEYTETHKYVPMIEGRSSIGRLGLLTHVTAGFGDVGFKGYWTLEMSSIKLLKIYPYVEIVQIYYHVVQGETNHIKYNGKYQNNTEIQSSKLYEDYKV